ncbi:MAG: ComEC/Rec2 family competence protein, partial [Acidimicrobiia bacterium]
GEVTLVGDPVPDAGGVAVDVRWRGRRHRAVARDAAAAALDDRLAGERVLVLGTLDPPGVRERRLAHRHLAGRLRVDHVVGWRSGDPVSRVANGLRRTLARGAEGLPARQASLLLGLTLGDVRAQPADMSDAFRAAGLTHILAVSGQNVAFVLVAASPMLTRLRLGARWAATLAVLGGFALLTRCEPSVLRATAMAGVAATGAALGRPATSLRTLALGVAAVMLVDPLLVGSLGFRLSVAGAAGIIVGSGPVARALPGPGWVTMPLAVTVAAQLAVAPLLVAAFGSVPLASLPANLLAVPVTGPVMVWGLTGGLAAGAAGGAVATVVHAPTRLGLAWIDAVASAAARWPLGELRWPHVAVLVAGTVVLVGVARRETAAARETGVRPRAPGTRRRMLVASLRVAAGVAVTAATLVAALGRPDGAAGTGSASLGIGATASWSEGAVVVELDGRARDGAVLGRLRAEGIDRVHVVVARTRARGIAGVVATLRRRWPGLVVLAPAPPPGEPDAGAPPGAMHPPAGSVVEIGGLRVTVEANTGGRLETRIVPLDSGGDPAGTR